VKMNFGLPCRHSMPESVSLDDIPTFYHLLPFGEFISLHLSYLYYIHLPFFISYIKKKH
jgi:hypothetical protein